MLFLPISLTLFLLFLLLIPVLFALTPAVAFAKMGLSPFLGYAFFILYLFGSGINFPVYREQINYTLPLDDVMALFLKNFGIRVPVTTDRIISLNPGGLYLVGLISVLLV